MKGSHNLQPMKCAHADQTNGKALYPANEKVLTHRAAPTNGKALYPANEKVPTHHAAPTNGKATSPSNKKALNSSI